MSTRRNKRILIPEDDISEQVPDKRNAATNTDEQLKISFQEQTAEIGQAPVFNIHIHVPATNERNSAKMYLPRIQPVIHVHFDELAKKLRNITSQQEGGLSEKYLQSAVTQITPKFGSVLFHYKNNSFKRHFNKNQINNFKQKQTLREKNSSIGLESNGSDQTETMQKHDPISTDQSDNNGANEITQEVTGSVTVSKGQPVKLKKAIVVLKDICKSNSYRSGAISDLLSYEKNHSANHSQGRSLDSVTNSDIQIKTEPAPSSPIAQAPDADEKPHAGCNNSYVNPFSSNNRFSSGNMDFVGQVKSIKRETLASLVEGCRFYDILEKFREKYSRSASECLEKPNILAEAQTVTECDKVPTDGNVWLTQNSAQTYCLDQSHDIDGKKQGDQEDNKDEVNMQDETALDGTKLCKIEDQPSLSSNERKLEVFTETSELSSSAIPSVEEIEKGGDQMNGDYGIQCSINQCHAAEIESDDCEITTRNKLSSDVEDFKNVEFDPSNYTSDTVIKSEFDLAETNNSCDEENQYFDLELITEEMAPPKQGTDKMVTYEKRKSSDVREKEPSPKKIKQPTEGTPKKLARKTAEDEGYIPLNIPGPTEFAVARLSKLQTCKEHDARNFKKDMLFGKRVNRFTSPDHLRVYKMKKQSAKRHCD